MFGLPVSTLRYYDKQGLFPGMERSSGVRRFSEAELEKLRVIQCLKETGMEIREIRQFMNGARRGPPPSPSGGRCLNPGRLTWRRSCAA